MQPSAQALERRAAAELRGWLELELDGLAGDLCESSLRGFGFRQMVRIAVCGYFVGWLWAKVEGDIIAAAHADIEGMLSDE